MIAWVRKIKYLSLTSLDPILPVRDNKSYSLNYFNPRILDAHNYYDYGILTSSTGEMKY